jgi:hypothetical protein
MQKSYFLPSQDLLFKMLDNDLKLIVSNYGATRSEDWEFIYKNSLEKKISPCARDTALNSEFEKPKCVPDSSAVIKTYKTTKNSPLVRNRSLGIKRRQSSTSKKIDVSAYKPF